MYAADCMEKYLSILPLGACLRMRPCPMCIVLCAVVSAGRRERHNGTVHHHHGQRYLAHSEWAHRVAAPDPDLGR